MVYLSFYKGKGKLFDRLIRWWTGGKYSHCELVLDNDWFSADAWTNKVRFTRFTPVRENWEFVEFPVTLKEQVALRAWCDSKVGKKYDYLQIFGCFIFNFGWEDKSRYTCSEVCIEALQRIGKFDRLSASRTSPVQLARMCGLK